MMNRKGEKAPSNKQLVKKPSEKNMKVSHSLAVAAHLRAFIYNI